MRRLRAAILSAMASSVIAIFPCASPARAQGDGNLHIYLISVGGSGCSATQTEGDSTLFVSPTGTRMLIDGGPGGTCGADIVTGTFSRVIPTGGLTYMVATNYDDDHIGGLDNEATYNNNQYMPTTIFDLGGASGSPSYDAAFRDKRVTAVVGSTLDLGGGLTAKFVAVDGNLFNGAYIPPANPNARSISVLFQYGGFDYLTSGDLDTQVEDPLGAALKAAGTQIDMIKVSHHGSSNSTSNAFCASVQAEFALISCGAGNTYGHPTQHTIYHLNAKTDAGAPYSPAYLPVQGIYLTEDPGEGSAVNVKSLFPLNQDGSGSIHVSVLNGGCQYTLSNEGPGTIVFNDGPYPSDSGPPCLTPTPTPAPTPSGPTPIPYGDWPVKLHVNKTTFSRNDSITVSADFRTCLTPFFPYVRLVDPFGRMLYLQRAAASSTRFSWTGPTRFVEGGPWVLNYDLDYYPVLNISYINAAYGTWALQGAFLDIYGNIIGGINEKQLTVQ